ncbi:MAG: isoprenyl transferase [Candidatus Cloacimonadaceae bacterium]
MNKKTEKLISELDLTRLPQHVAIIMDGNGRWAKQRHRPRLYGHRAGAKSVRRVVELAGELNIPHLSVYAFSTENWTRPQDEVSGLLKLLMEYLNKEIDELHRKNVNVSIIGSQARVDQNYLSKAHKITSRTWSNTGLHFNVMFNYGGRQEIIDAFKSLSQDVMSQKLDPALIDADIISQYLYTKDIPDPDLIIRTSGELRLSNFLIWQAAYAEIYVTETLWPDFDKKEFVIALKDFQNRKRRFGGVDE